MQRTNIYLEAGQCQRLDHLAAEEGISRAELIRRLLDRALAGGHDDRPGDLDAIDASFGALRDLEPLARGADERSQHLDRAWSFGD